MIPFIGSAPRPCLSWLRQEIAKEQPPNVQILCSGNFRLEQTAIAAGVKTLAGNDVSLYSCLIGRGLEGHTFDVQFSGRLDWANQLRDRPIELAQMLLTWLSCQNKSESQRIASERVLETQRESLLSECAKRADALRSRFAGVAWSFVAGDMRDALEAAPKDALVLAFPPTYGRGYEKMFAPLEEVARWHVDYRPISKKEVLAWIGQLLDAKRPAYVLTDVELADRIPAYCLRKPLARDVWIYSNRDASARLEEHGAPRWSQTDYPIGKAADLLEQPPELRPVEATQYLRMARRQMKAAVGERLVEPDRCFLVLCRGRVIGMFGFVTRGKVVASIAPHGIANHPVCALASDLACAPDAKEYRLAKLVVRLALSEDVRRGLEGGGRGLTIAATTSVFSDGPVSMKYRNVMRLTNREKMERGYRLRYEGDFGPHSVTQAWEEWRRKHGAGSEK